MAKLMRKNSQGRNTVKAILTPEDSSDLSFREFLSNSLVNQVGTNRDDIKLTLGNLFKILLTRCQLIQDHIQQKL